MEKEMNNGAQKPCMTRKLIVSGAVGALTTLVFAVLDRFAPGLRVAFAPEIESLISLVAGMVVAYFANDRKISVH